MEKNLKLTIELDPKRWIVLRELPDGKVNMVLNSMSATMPMKFTKSQLLVFAEQLKNFAK